MPHTTSYNVGLTLHLFPENWKQLQVGSVRNIRSIFLNNQKICLQIL